MNDWLFYIYLGLVGLCWLAFLTNRDLPPSFVPFRYLLPGILVCESVRMVLRKNAIHFYLTDHLYQIFEFTCLVLVYRGQIKSSKVRNSIRYAIPAFWTVSILCMFFVEGLGQTNEISFTLESAIMVFLSLYFFYELYTLPPQRQDLLKDAFFWITTGTLFYCAGTFFQMGLDRYLHNHNQALAVQLRYISYFLNYLMYILYLIGFLCKTSTG